MSQATPTPLAASRMTPFLSSEAIEKQPAWSPTGDLIAYVSDAAGNDDIWIADPSGAHPLNLTHTLPASTLGRPGLRTAEAWPSTRSVTAAASTR